MNRNLEDLVPTLRDCMRFNQSGVFKLVVDQLAKRDKLLLQVFGRIWTEAAQHVNVVFLETILSVLESLPECHLPFLNEVREAMTLRLENESIAKKTSIIQL